MLAATSPARLIAGAVRLDVKTARLAEVVAASLQRTAKGYRYWLALSLKYR